MTPPPAALFTLATLSPMGLIALAALGGGHWALVALIYMTVATIALDLLIPVAAQDDPDREIEFPAAEALLAGIGLGALCLLPLTVWAIAGPSDMTLPQRIALFFAAGLWLGQVGHPAAHEMIHRPTRALRGLGVALYSALLFGHHASSHRLVHHRHVATADDPNTARAGMGFYRFMPRAWVGSFRAGLRAENQLRARNPAPGLHPYAVYVGGAIGGLVCGYALAGAAGVAVWAGLGVHAASQILLSDYVQHYGLTRARLASGKVAPVGAAHSWNTPHWFSQALMLNAPRHSDHHNHPGRPFATLRLPADAPTLPWPLPLACLIALAPPLWRSAMRPLLAQQAVQDTSPP